MSLKTQEKHMKRLSELVTQDLTYIHGERESGPNGAKREYLQTGKTFLRAMAKDLGFTESRVYDSPGGIGVAGEIVMMGMWSEGNGIHVYIRENDLSAASFTAGIKHMKDYTGDRNRFLGLDYLTCGYQNLLDKFLELRQEETAYVRAS